jgi:hypothetical protein
VVQRCELHEPVVLVTEEAPLADLARS